MKPERLSSDKPAEQRAYPPINETVAPSGVPGFHNKQDGGDGPPLAAMELDADTPLSRVDTGTGDQPGNTGGSRFATPSGEAEHADDTRSGTELHEEHVGWWKDLCVWQEEVKRFERRLAEVADEHPEGEVLAQLEQYQNRMFREQEVIDELQHLVKTHETSLEQRVRAAHPQAIGVRDSDHTDLRERMRTASTLHVSLRREFMRWSNERRPV